MTNAQLQIKIKERLNKLASQDYENIECWQVAEAFNKAQLEWVRRQINGVNQLRHGEGSSQVNYDDIQKLMTTVALPGQNQENSWVSQKYPSNYLYYSSMYALGKNDCCPERNIIVYLVDKADLFVILRDANKKPSFEWGETVAIMADNTFIIYTNGEFEITETNFTYYRKPVMVSFEGCTDISTGLPSLNVECEFKDDVAEILVDEAVSILAADIESFNQYNRAKTAVQNNT